MIQVLCVGKLKERFYADGCAEYLKRLSRYYETELIEVKDLKAGESLSAAQREDVMRAEGEAMLKRMSKSAYAVALAIEGRALSSEALADTLRSLRVGGKPDIAFLIGGSLGLGHNVIERADCQISLSKLTLPHALARLVLLEQLYRAHTILAGEPYHK